MTQNKKRRDEKKHSRGKKEAEDELEVPSYFNYIFGISLLAIFFLSLYLRAVMPYDSVFSNGVVAFASDDAVFHMRLVENTLYNFPHRIFYDAFTMYPYGQSLHWGPLWTQLIATLSLIAGMGGYNMQTVNTIGAFMPAIFGALVVFPVYSIGKHIGNRSTGLLAALMIAVLPGQFFSRSILGFTDHRVMEVFFSTATIAFFILALRSGLDRNIKISNIHIKEKTVLYSIFAGIMLAAYHLFWPGALLFVMILLIYIVIQYIVDNMRGRSTDYLAVAAVPMFLVDLLLILPYINPSNGFALERYSWFHLAVPLAGIMLPVVSSIISSELKKREYGPHYFPLSLGGFFVLGILLMNIALPQLYSTAINAPNAIFAPQHGGGLTIAEDSPISDRAGMLWSNFPITGFLPKTNSVMLDDFVLLFSIIVLLAIGYRVAKKQRPEDLLFLVWGAVMLLSMYGQNRWAYYFAVNIALLVGYAGVALSEKILKFGGWKWQIDRDYLRNISSTNILSLILVIMLVVFFAYPSMVATAIGTKDQEPISKWGGGDPSGGGFNEWYETLTWMRNNTPDPGMDYLAIYDKPANGRYPYPQTAYGVMSWWDYGHIITYWAHRIPNANPFQSGIGGGVSHAPGASTFLVAKSEDEANKVLDALGTNGKPGARYIVSNGYMAYAIQAVFATWNMDDAIADPAFGNQNLRPDPTKYYESYVYTDKGPTQVPGLRNFNSMEGKLHILDGNGLEQYRLVHESPANPNTQGGYQERYFKTIYNALYGGNIPVEDSGLVKVFEYVKGAKITGHAPPNTTVTLTNTIKTNIGRTIQYSQTTSSDGTYTFTVPYSTLGPLPGETQFDTKPTGPYTVTSGNISKKIDVSEKDVLEGHTVTLNLV